MRVVLLVGLGGLLGAVLRYGLSGIAQALLHSFEFPIGTLLVNVAGSFVLVFLASAADSLGVFGPSFRSFVFIGLLGAFTTFSTFSLETVSLLFDGQGMLAMGNVLLNVGLCLAAAWVGRAAVIWIWGWS